MYILYAHHQLLLFIVCIIPNSFLNIQIELQRYTEGEASAEIVSRVHWFYYYPPPRLTHAKFMKRCRSIKQINRVNAYCDVVTIFPFLLSCMSFLYFNGTAVKLLNPAILSDCGGGMVHENSLYCNRCCNMWKLMDFKEVALFLYKQTSLGATTIRVLSISWKWFICLWI